MNVGKLNSYFGEGTVLKGTLKFKGLLRFDGDFEGDVQSEDTFIVGDTGRVRANIKTGHLFNFGGINGDVEATQKISLHSESRLEGNIKTPSLITEERAFFQGSCYMPARPPQEGAAKAKKAPEVAPPSVDASGMEQAPASSSSGYGAVAAAALVILAGAAGAWYYLGSDGLAELNPFAARGVRARAVAPSQTAQEQQPAPAPTGAEPVQEAQPVAETKPPVEEMKQPESREETLAASVGKTPKEAGPRLELAGFYIEKRRYKDAIKTLEEAKSAIPSNNDIISLLAATYHRTGREKDALEQFKIVAKANPNSVEAKSNRAFQRLEIGALDDAEKLFTEVLAADPDNFRARLGLATVYSKQEENEKAIKECRRILDKADDYAPALNRLAWIYAKKNENLEEAEAFSKKSMAVFDDIPEYIDTLSEINFRRGNYDEAIRLIKRAIALTPGDSYYERQLFKFQRASRKG